MTLNSDHNRRKEFGDTIPCSVKVDDATGLIESAGVGDWFRLDVDDGTNSPSEFCRLRVAATDMLLSPNELEAVSAFCVKMAEHRRDLDAALPDDTPPVPDDELEEER